MPTRDLLSKLVLNNPRMWGVGSSFGRELTMQRMGRMLATGFKVHSERQGDSARGYYRNALAPAWRRMGVTPLPKPTDPPTTAPLYKPTEPTEPVKPTGAKGVQQADTVCPKHGTPTHQGMCGRCEAEKVSA